jgi:hypothetical protein
MTYTTTTRLALKKAVPGSNQAFETVAFNNNWDAIDTDSISANSRITALETTVAAGTGNAAYATTAGSATTATTATTAVTSQKILASSVSRTVYVQSQSSAPTSPVVGDIWIKTA